MKDMIPKRRGGHEMDPRVPICKESGDRGARERPGRGITSTGRGKGYSGSQSDSLILGNGPQQHSGLERRGTGRNHPPWAVSVPTSSHPVLTGHIPGSEKEQVPQGSGLAFEPAGLVHQGQNSLPLPPLAQNKKHGRKRTQMNESDL